MVWQLNLPHNIIQTSKSSFSALRTAFCVTTATVFCLCCENVEQCQTRQSKPTPYFTHSQASNFDKIQYFSKFHVHSKAVPFVTIIMDKTQLNVQHNHNHKQLPTPVQQAKCNETS